MSSNASASGHSSFSLLHASELFQLAMQDPRVDLKQYIAAYRELAKVLPQLGCIFHFVVYDIEEKLRVIESFQACADTGRHYSYGEDMLEFERANNLLYKKHLYSGSRAFFVLHRALRFLVRFIGDLKTCDKHDKISTIAHRAYDDTLGSKVHSWWVVKAVHLAVYTLPNRHQLLQTIGVHLSAEDQDRQMTAAIEIGGEIYSVVQMMFEKRSMLDIDPKSSMF